MANQLKYAKGNLINLADEGKFDIIMHGCNCFCSMKAGITLSISERWPESEKIDQKTKKADVHKLGSFSVANVKTKIGTDLMVLNAYTQYKPGADFKLIHLEQALLRLQEIYETDLRIGIPMIGCGIGGGNWEEVEKSLKENFNKLDLTVVLL